VGVLVRFGKTDLFDTDTVHESELGRVIDALAARPQLFTDEDERAAILHVAAHFEGFIIYLRRDPARRAAMIRDAQNETPAKGCNPAGVGITIQRDRIEREQHNANAG
jgi:hypothetical protein